MGKDAFSHVSAHLFHHLMEDLYFIDYNSVQSIREKAQKNGTLYDNASKWSHSSVGRALPRQGRGHWFESSWDHHSLILIYSKLTF